MRAISADESRSTAEPSSEVAILGLPRRKVQRQPAPGAAGTQNIHNRLDHDSQVALATHPEIGSEADHEYYPLRVAQPREIGWDSSF